MATRAFGSGDQWALFVLIISALPLPGQAAPEGKTDPWQPIRFLSGEWEGTAEGQAGSGCGGEGFENFSSTWKARETYDILSNSEFVETFELAAPGKSFETYSRSRFKRIKENNP